MNLHEEIFYTLHILAASRASQRWPWRAKLNGQYQLAGSRAEANNHNNHNDYNNQINHNNHNNNDSFQSDRNSNSLLFPATVLLVPGMLFCA